jgi:hypothetical protein
VRGSTRSNCQSKTTLLIGSGMACVSQGQPTSATRTTPTLADGSWADEIQVSAKTTYAMLLNNTSNFSFIRAFFWQLGFITPTLPCTPYIHHRYWTQNDHYYLFLRSNFSLISKGKLQDEISSGNEHKREKKEKKNLPCKNYYYCILFFSDKRQFITHKTQIILLHPGARQYKFSFTKG